MSAPLKPPHRRRRWFIAALTVLALGLWWWWPRLDPRLIGTWDLRLKVDETRLLGRVTLHEDGRLSIVAPMNVNLPSSWHVDSDMLVCGSRLPASMDFASPFVVPLMRTLTGRPDWGRQSRYELTEIVPDAIDLRYEVDLGRYVLRRVITSSGATGE